jgi:hypothetical protein
LDHDIVSVDYFISSGDMWRADRGALELVEGAEPGHYWVVLSHARFDELAGLELNGVIGAKLEHYACSGCA